MTAVTWEIKFRSYLKAHIVYLRNVNKNYSNTELKFVNIVLFHVTGISTYKLHLIVIVHFKILHN